MSEEENFLTALFRWATIDYGFFQKPTEELTENINEIAYEFYLKALEDDEIFHLTTYSKDEEEEVSREKLVSLITHGFASLLALKKSVEEIPEEPQAQEFPEESQAQEETQVSI